MSALKIREEVGTFVDDRTGAETAVIGLLAREEFAWARLALPDLNHYADYDDWLDAREGLQLGLSMAGVDARIVVVELRRFLAWRRLTGMHANEGALDAFAARISRFQGASSACAIVSKDDFERYTDASPFAEYAAYEDWLGRRALAHRTSEDRVEELPVRIGDFLAWCRCVGETASEASLDKYATLVFEFLVQDA